MDIISPVSSVFFLHSRFSFVDMGNIHQGLPAHLFFSMKQVSRNTINFLFFCFVIFFHLLITGEIIIVYILTGGFISVRDFS